MISTPILTLCDLKPGSCAEIQDYVPDCSHRVRFAELGLHPGAQIEVLRVAPLRDPIQIRVGGALLSIRKREARSILVKASSDH